MALFEYRCNACGRTFEALVLDGDETPSCPVCGSGDLEKLLSTFAVNAKSAAAPMPSCPSGGCCGGGCGMM